MDRLLEMFVKFRGLITQEDGQDLAEYGLLVVLVALGAITSIGYVSTALATMFTNIGNSIG
jgi:Flp pilus assembly pilin Flp